MVGRLFAVAAFALAINACSDSSGVPTENSTIPDSPAFGVSVTQIHTDFGPLTINNPCQPEALTFSGKIHHTFKVRDDGSLEVRTNYADLKGVGLSTGNTYVLQQNAFTQILDPLPFPVFQTTQAHSRLISKGGNDNNYIVIEQSLYLDPPNAPVSVTNIESECRG